LAERESEHVAVRAKVLDRCPLGQDMSAFQSPKGEMLIALSLGLERGGHFCLYVRSDLFGKRRHSVAPGCTLGVLIVSRDIWYELERSG
jgi:hypothetical protein